MLNISDLYEREVLLCMHDFNKGKLPLSFMNVFNTNREMNVGYENRQVDQLIIPRSRSCDIDRLPYIMFPTIWNKWYPDSGAIPSRAICKSRFSFNSLVNTPLQSNVIIQCAMIVIMSSRFQCVKSDTSHIPHTHHNFTRYSPVIQAYMHN